MRTIKGTSIGWAREDLENSTNALGLKLISVSQTYKISCSCNEDSDKRKTGIIEKAINGITNDIHNLAIIIDMMQNISISKGDKYNLYLSLLIENYYTNLRSMFDFLPNIIKIGLDESQSESLPKKDSFNALLKYVNNDNNKDKLPEMLIKCIKQGEEIFNIIKMTRDMIIHKGDEPIIFIKNDEFYFGILKLKDKGQINLVQNILDTEELIYPVFAYFKELTNRVIEFIEALADVVHFVWSKKEDQDIALYLAALEGVCIPDFIEFLGWISDGNGE